LEFFGLPAYRSDSDLFSEYEAKVYLTLLHENSATGYHLSKKWGVPRSMAYEALGRLAV
jgi:sugar-specific transcriptional regulator TrmB